MFTIHITTLMIIDEEVSENTKYQVSTSVVSFPNKVEAEIAIQQLSKANDNEPYFTHSIVRLYIP